MLSELHGLHPIQNPQIIGHNATLKLCVREHLFFWFHKRDNAVPRTCRAKMTFSQSVLIAFHTFSEINVYHDVHATF